MDTTNTAATENTMRSALINFASENLGGSEDPIRTGESVTEVATGLVVNGFGAESFDDALVEFGYSDALTLAEDALTLWAEANGVDVHVGEA